MKRALLIIALLCCAAAYVFLQTVPPSRSLATLMPSGALLYLEAPDFGRILRDWSSSQTKSGWLASQNYAAFSRSNLFTKLQGVYTEYGAAAGFVPDLPRLIEIAGSESALALYGIRDVEFLYITRMSQPDLAKSQLWTVRDKFQQRQAAGVDFYLRTDPASKRTVAFAFSKDYLFLTTRDDLVAQSLELLAGASNPSAASDRWYRDNVAAATDADPRELRLVMNLDSLVKSTYLPSYWIQRNVSELRRYSAGLADVGRTGGDVIENRVFLHAPDAVANSPSDVASLVALVPPEAGLYRAQAADPASTAALIAQKLIGSPTQRARDWREAPNAIPEDQLAGSEADLETRIDEQPLPEDAGFAASTESIRALHAKAGVESVLLVECSAPLTGTFIHMPSTIVLSARGGWDPAAVQTALGEAAAKLWTTSGLGGAWTISNAAGYTVNQLDGLGSLMYVARGSLLFISNDLPLLTAVVNRAGAAQAPATPLTYLAGFRHTRERANFERIMTALDFGAGGPPGAPPFFSANVASLSRTLSNVSEVQVTQREQTGVTIQRVVYQLTR
jgi:hypothetical protein